MRRLLQRLWQDTSGSVIIYVAISMIALAAIGIVGVDVGKIMVARVDLQNAADAGALAGARMFLDGVAPSEGDIITESKDIAGMNRAFYDGAPELIARDDIGVGVDMGAQEVTVRTESMVSHYFTGVIGRGRADAVQATATAKLGAVCAASCLKPWSIPDRHDDLTLIQGHGDWQNNGYYDHEDFVDVNENRTWEPGESYEDTNNNGLFDQELYHPLITGYTASKDHGLQINLKANNGGKPEPGQFWPIDLPDPEGSPGVGGSWYRWNIANCNSSNIKPGDWLFTENGNMVGPTRHGMREIYDKDPNAIWEDGCECVSDSDYATSPRIGIIPIHDPRWNITPGKQEILVVKLAAFFIEDIRGNGEVVGRFMKLSAPGELCPEGTDNNGGFLFNLSLIE